MAQHREQSMKPLPETRRAMEKLAQADGQDLVERFQTSADLAAKLVPECVGVSLSLLKDGLTFTWVSTGRDTSGLDAVQYLDGGPCVDAVERGVTVEVTSDDLFDEGRWLFFARAEGAAGVASSLSMPIMVEDRVVGGVNLYASTSDAFEGRREAVGELFGAWVPGAVTNADLSFSTRERARKAPGTMQEQALVNQAVGMIVAAHQVTSDQAHDKLRTAAARADLSEVEVATYVVRTHLL
jgi:GAF domain-containing protein